MSDHGFAVALKRPLGLAELEEAGKIDLTMDLEPVYLDVRLGYLAEADVQTTGSTHVLVGHLVVVA